MFFFILNGHAPEPPQSLTFVNLFLFFFEGFPNTDNVPAMLHGV